MASSKRRKESKPRTPRATEVAPAIAPVERSPAIAPVERSLAPMPPVAPVPPVPPVALVSTDRALPLSRCAALPAPLAEPLAAVATSRPVSTQERRELVARAAYQRAVQHGLGRTDPVEDWLWAEREIERRLGAQTAA
jgi:hypothetical protein